MGSAARMRCKVDWSNGGKTAIIVVMRSTPGKVGGQYYSYCAWERASLSSPLKDRSLASKNYLLPSSYRMKPTCLYSGTTGSLLAHSSQRGAISEILWL